MLSLGHRCHRGTRSFPVQKVDESRIEALDLEKAALVVKRAAKMGGQPLSATYCQSCRAGHWFEIKAGSVQRELGSGWKERTLVSPGILA